MTPATATPASPQLVRAPHTPATDAGAPVAPVGVRLAAWVLWAGCVLAALGVWIVFWPGLLSSDSIDQVTQARNGAYHDWHPPFMAICLSGLFRLGADLSAVMLAQALLFILGVRALLGALLRLQLGPTWSCAAIAAAAGGGALFLLLPLSPLAFYLVTLWKDCWLAIALLWLIVGGLRVWLAAGRSPHAAAWLLLLVPLAAVVPLIRHNAVVVLPAVCLLLGWTAARGLGWRGWAVALLPPALYFGANSALYRLFPIERLRPANQIKALELVGVCYVNPAAIGELPFTAAHLRQDIFRERYFFATVGPLIWEQPPIVTPGYVTGGPNDELGREYLLALRRFPRELIEVKLRALVWVSGWYHTPYWFQPRLEPNNLGLAHTATLEPLRHAWVSLAGHVAAHPRLRWVGGVAGVWAAANVVLLLLCVFLRCGTRRAMLLVLLIPLAYYASYVLAAPAQDFRLTYPATLMVQIASLAVFIAAARTVLWRRSPDR